ncbi:hypothetical protein MalM25_34750 [Planctomycetes bacterium MalM25]|nr:hypothetical protein MalM25_34750 [Planctomycetes bacterium MalM25]
MCDEDEILLRYHFGDLDACEREAFEQRLRDEPGLSERLEALRRCLEKNGEPCDEQTAPAEPPNELAERTAHSVLAWKDEAPCGGRKRFSLTEAVAIGGCAMLVGALIVPALYAARVSARRAECSNNLRLVGQGLHRYAGQHGGHFPSIGRYENAGFFTVKLAEHGYLDRPTFEKALLCPSSELANQVAVQKASVVVPSLDDLRRANDSLFDRLVRLMSGSYAYNFNYSAAQLEKCPDKKPLCQLPIMADAPRRGCKVSFFSENHGECGQNVLFHDGGVRFVSGCWAPEVEDHLYLNDAGQVAAGERPDDAVLAPSEATPSGARVVRFRLLRFP